MKNYKIIQSSKVSDNYYIYSAIKNKIALLKIPNIEKINENELENILEYKFKFVNTNVKNLKIDSMYDFTIVVSNVCNMDCGYCYANQGNFGRNDDIMDRTIADEIINFIRDKYSTIERVTFFGGEPLLAIDTIDYICNEFIKLYESKKISKIPKFLTITNGTILDEKVINTLKKYNIICSVSIDAFREEHNEYRKFKNGKHTYNVIKNNLKKLNELKLVSSIQVVYRKSFIEKGITVEDIKKYYYKEFGIKHFIINKITLDHNVRDKNLFLQEYTMEEFHSLKGNSISNQLELYLEYGITDKLLFESIYSLFKNSRSSYLCNAAILELAISSEGYIYPCRNLVSKDYKEKFCMGNLIEINNGNEKKYRDKQIEILNKNKLKEDCMSCKNISICGSCIATDYLRYNDYGYLPEINCKKISDDNFINGFRNCIEKDNNFEKLIKRVLGDNI